MNKISVTCLFVILCLSLSVSTGYAEYCEDHKTEVNTWLKQNIGVTEEMTLWKTEEEFKNHCKDYVFYFTDISADILNVSLEQMTQALQERELLRSR